MLSLAEKLEAAQTVLGVERLETLVCFCSKIPDHVLVITA